MKKFRLFTLLAVVATVSTSFAAWTYYSYSNQFAKQTEGMTLQVDGGPVTADEAIDIEFTNQTMPSVIFKQSTTNQRSVNSEVTSDITVKVTANFNADDINLYDFYYVVYNKYTQSDLPNLKSLNEYETDGQLKTTENSLVKKLTLSADGTATIAAVDISEYFVVEENILSDNPEAFEGSLVAFANMIADVENSGTYLKVYAVKK